MNVMLAAGGYPWAIIPVQKRNDYIQSLEAASVRQDIKPFTEFLATLITSPKVCNFQAPSISNFRPALTATTHVPVAVVKSIRNAAPENFTDAELLTCTENGSPTHAHLPQAEDK